MVDVANANAVAVLTRAPSAGGKQRLFAALGRPVDPALLEALLLDTIDGAASAGASMVLSLAGEADGLGIGQPGIAGDLHVIQQPIGHLGERMRGTMAALFAAGARRVALIGSDLPAITATPIREAFRLLELEPASLVLGPALDGGYYLIAATVVPPVFDDIEWGSGRVLAQTCAAAAAAGLPVRLVAPMADVDTVEDLIRLPARAVRSVAWSRANGLTAASARARASS